MQNFNFKTIFEPRNRGILLDIVVLVINLVLMSIITRLTLKLAHEAEQDRLARIAIGLFFAGVFFLQPCGPILKRWSFHQRFKFDTDSSAGCLLFWFMWFYIIMMLLLSGTATIILTEVFFERGSPASEIGPALILGGLALSIVNVVFIYRFFLRPKKKPRWKFLATPQAALVGDVLMFLNVICLQILWNSLTASKSFWEHLTSTPLGKPGSFTDILGRFIVIGFLALLVYFPARIFYLVEDKNRKITWLTMLLANMPLILRAVFASPR
ncbi:MAG: hypothetical protein M3R67_05740 [Acidobacteriota bacterium]|nr:hypothetical protein [Acidobacteriota bacterium]